MSSEVKWFHFWCQVVTHWYHVLILWLYYLFLSLFNYPISDAEIILHLNDYLKIGYEW